MWTKRRIDFAPLQRLVVHPERKFALPSLPASYKGLPGILADALQDDGPEHRLLRRTIEVLAQKPL